jgi:hypothetical protein
MKKVTAKKVERLRKAIWDYLEEKIRKPEVEFFGSDHAKGGKWDPLVSVGVRSSPISGADLELYYDGIGYDHLSPNGGGPETAEKHQSALSELARKLDFHAEEYDSTSLAFYYEG